MEKLVRQSGAAQTESAQAMNSSANAVSSHVATLQRGIDGLNSALDKLGGRQIEVQVPARNGWFSKRRKSHG